MNHDYQRWVKLASWASLLVAGLLIVTKLYAWAVTGSASLMAALTDSFLDAVASGMNFFVIRFALEPADDEHRFGHGKAESLAGLGQAAFICGSSLLLVFHAVSRMYQPVELHQPLLGMAVSIFAIVITLVLVSFQHFVVKRTGSVAIKADSLHYKGDLLLNGAVVVAIWLSTRGIAHVDAIFAILIAVFLIYNAWTIAIESAQSLMDAELSEQEQQQIMAIALAHPKVDCAHQLRTRQAGPTKFIQIHIAMDDDLTLFKAHQVAQDVERAIKEAFAHADVIIHQDPISVGIE
jgi:ferrous-iron efflux pump FieF